MYAKRIDGKIAGLFQWPNAIAQEKVDTESAEVKSYIRKSPSVGKINIHEELNKLPDKQKTKIINFLTTL